MAVSASLRRMRVAALSIATPPPAHTKVSRAAPLAPVTSPNSVFAQISNVTAAPGHARCCHTRTPQYLPATASAAVTATAAAPGYHREVNPATAGRNAATATATAAVRAARIRLVVGNLWRNPTVIPPRTNTMRIINVDCPAGGRTVQAMPNAKTVAARIISAPVPCRITAVGRRRRG